MASGIDILRLIPAVAAIGRFQLQGYCDEWVARPIARQFGITHLIVGSDLMLTANIDDQRATFTDGHVFIPIDELAGYIIDQHFQDVEARRQLHSQLRDLRDRWSDAGYQYEVLAGRVGRLWLTCKSCGEMLETAQQAIEGQRITMPQAELTCPLCGCADYYDGGDFRLIVND